MSNQQSKTNEKKIGCPILEFFAIFSSFHHQLSLILHRITAWDNVQYLVELRPPKEFVAQIRAEVIFPILMLSGVHSNLLVFINVRNMRKRYQSIAKFRLFKLLLYYKRSAKNVSSSFSVFSLFPSFPIFPFSVSSLFKFYEKSQDFLTSSKFLLFSLEIIFIEIGRSDAGR